MSRTSHHSGGNHGGVDPDGRSRRYDPFWDNANDLLLRAIVGILYLLECLAGTLATGEDPKTPRRYLKMNNVFKLAALIKVTGDGEGDSRWTTL